MAEIRIMRDIIAACSRGASRIFRANSGMGWTGKVVGRTARTITLEDPRVFRAHETGFPDTIGWRTVEITQDMVGSRIAQFVALEIKAADGRVRPEQRAFLAAAERAGCCVGIARSEQDAADLLSAPIRPG
jgi:hypothetical protein